MQTLPGVLPLYTASEMRTIDRLTVDEVGIPGIVLMERAGLGAAADILGIFPLMHRVAVICGPGNNGGDGFVVARHLAAAGRDVEILLVEAESKTRRESRTNLQVARKLEIPVQRVNATSWKRTLREFDLLVDAMLGTGVTGAPRPNMEHVIRAMRDTRLPVVALDIPSGVDASTGCVDGEAVQADVTITFHGPKVGLAVAPGRFHAGRVKVLDIGIPARLEAPVTNGIATRELLALVPDKPRDSNKYTVGTVACVGGSVGMTGAIALAARAAARAGAGVVWGLVPDPIAGPLDVAIPEVQFRGAIADEQGRLTVAAAERLEPQLERADVTIVGPGLGESEQTQALARWAARTVPRLVLDAQALSAFADDTRALAARDGDTTVLTPHEGELARLIAQPPEQVRANRLESARHAAMQTRCTVMLKGEDTIVCEPDGNFLVASSHASAATAGSGDVLAGTVAALIARGLPTQVACACAALACGAAAELAARRYSQPGVIAGDMIDFLPAALALRDPARDADSRP